MKKCAGHGGGRGRRPWRGGASHRGLQVGRLGGAAAGAPGRARLCNAPAPGRCPGQLAARQRTQTACCVLWCCTWAPSPSHAAPRLQPQPCPCHRPHYLPLSWPFPCNCYPAPATAPQRRRYCQPGAVRRRLRDAARPAWQVGGGGSPPGRQAHARTHARPSAVQQHVRQRPPCVAQPSQATRAPACPPGQPL